MGEEQTDLDRGRIILSGKNTRVVCFDPATKKIICDPQGEMDALQRTIREAALKTHKILKDKHKPKWIVLHGQGPELDEDQAAPFFIEMAKLIYEHKSFMDKDGDIKEIQEEIDGKLKRTRERIRAELNNLSGISKKKLDRLVDKLFQELQKEMEKCLTAEPNRIKKEDKEIILNPSSWFLP